MPDPIVTWFHSRANDCDHTRHLPQCEVWAREFRADPPTVAPTPTPPTHRRTP
jgi:hypothetical protein